jgi:hypothetical protein
MKPLSKTQMAVMAGKSVYHSLRVKSVSDGMAKTERALKASTNVKLGKRVTKGKLSGFPILTLTLEERATCPASCIHWADCYGNNMMNATRYAGDDALLQQIEADLTHYQAKYPKGFLVRLHVLGDFFSVAYVAQWAKWLSMFPALHVYGYTANQYDAIDSRERAIGEALLSLRLACGIRFAVRFSGSYTDSFAALSNDDSRSNALLAEKKAFICPTQISKETGKLAKKDEETLAPDCGSCGLCWQASKPVVFLTH